MITSDSVLTCPLCGHSESMPLPLSDAPDEFSCSGCHAVVQKKEGDCCIFCSYGSHKCTVQQGWELLEEKQRFDRRYDKNFIPALGFKWLTGFYDLTIRATMPEERFRAKLVQEIAPAPGERILEFGYGTGTNLLRAYKFCPESFYYGLDIDEEVHNIAASKLKKEGVQAKLELYDGGNFPFTDHRFDKVYSCLVFHQLDASEKLHCLREIYRVLKPGGSLTIGDWGMARSKRMRLAFYTVQLLDGFKTTTDNVKGRMPDFMTNAGFSSVCETAYINTAIGTFSYYSAVKSSY